VEKVERRGAEEAILSAPVYDIPDFYKVKLPLADYSTFTTKKELEDFKTLTERRLKEWLQSETDRLKPISKKISLELLPAGFEDEIKVETEQLWKKETESAAILDIPAFELMMMTDKGEKRFSFSTQRNVVNLQELGFPMECYIPNQENRLILKSKQKGCILYQDGFEQEFTREDKVLLYDGVSLRLQDEEGNRYQFSVKINEPSLSPALPPLAEIFIREEKQIWDFRITKRFETQIGCDASQRILMTGREGGLVIENLSDIPLNLYKLHEMLPPGLATIVDGSALERIEAEAESFTPIEVRWIRTPPKIPRGKVCSFSLKTREGEKDGEFELPLKRDASRPQVLLDGAALTEKVAKIQLDSGNGLMFEMKMMFYSDYLKLQADVPLKVNSFKAPNRTWIPISHHSQKVQVGASELRFFYDYQERLWRFQFLDAVPLSKKSYAPFFDLLGHGNQWQVKAKNGAMRINGQTEREFVLSDFPVLIENGCLTFRLKQDVSAAFDSG
jgi:hypothetical protein